MAFVVARERRSRAERFSVRTVSVLSSPSGRALGGAGMLGLQTSREIEQEPLRGLYVGALIGAAQDRLGPRPLPVIEILEDVAHLVHRAALHERGLAEGRAHRFAQRLRPVEDHEQAAVGAQAATLEIREQALAHGGVLRRAVPEAKRVFLAIGRDAESHDEAVIADVDAVDQQRDQVECVERRTLPGRELRPRPRDEAAADGALAGACVSRDAQALVVNVSRRCRRRLFQRAAATFDWDFTAGVDSPRGESRRHVSVSGFLVGRLA